MMQRLATAITMNVVEAFKIVIVGGDIFAWSGMETSRTG